MDTKNWRSNFLKDEPNAIENTKVCNDDSFSALFQAISYNMSHIHNAEFRSAIEQIPKSSPSMLPVFNDKPLPLPLPQLPPQPLPTATPAKKKTKGKNERKARKYVQIIDTKYVDYSTYTYPGSKRKSSPLEKCPICKKFFRRMKTHLMKHADAPPKPGDPLTCQYCHKMFNSGSNLSIHLRTHTGDKPYVCEVCSKGFAQSCNLTNHMRTHTGEKPFKCPHCERAFTQSGNLSNHIRLHTDEKPFRCHFCDRAFVQSGNLNSHIKNNHREFYDNPQLYPL